MKTILVLPVTGRMVRDPVTRQAVPKEGLTVEENSFWLRRIAAGDVKVGEPAKPTKK